MSLFSLRLQPFLSGKTASATSFTRWSLSALPVLSTQSSAATAKTKTTVTTTPAWHSSLDKMSPLRGGWQLITPNHIHTNALPASNSGTAFNTSLAWQALINLSVWFIKRTFQPSIMKRKRRLGFLVRQRTVGGRKVLKRRRLKGRARLDGGI